MRSNRACRPTRSLVHDLPGRRRFSAQLCWATYAAELLPKIDAAIAESGQINMLVVIDHLKGWEDKDAAKADYDFGTQQYRHVGRCAFVSNKRWHRWAIKLMDPFTRRTDEKTFEPAELDEAWAWACGEAE